MRTSAASFLCLISLCASAGEAFDPARTQYPDRARCALNLIEVGQGIKAFVLAREGRFPSKLSDVFAVDTELGGWRSLICPAKGPLFTQEGLAPSYAYVNMVGERGPEDDDRSDIVVFDRDSAHQGGRNVLLADFENVEYLEQDEFERRLADQRAKWEKRGGKVEIVYDDLIPLAPRQMELYRLERRSFLGSPHFKVAAVLAGAIVVVLVLLIVQSRKRKSPGG